MDIPVKLCFRVGFDILLMIVFQGEKNLKALIILHVQIPLNKFYTNFSEGESRNSEGI